MRTVHKFQIGIGEDEVEIDLPVSATVVFVGSQEDGMVHFWVELDDADKTIERTFVLHGTGDEIPKDHSYVGTVVNHSVTVNHHAYAGSGPLWVWHLYEMERRG